MKILYLNPAGCLGGAEKSLLDLVKNLPPSFQPLLACLGEGPFLEELRRAGVEAELIPLPAYLRGLSRGRGKNRAGAVLLAPFLIQPILFRLARLIRSHRVEIIHTNGIKAHLLGILLRGLTGRKLIWHFRDLPEEPYAGIFRRLGRLFPQRVIANSRAVKTRLGDLDKIKVVYNGINFTDFLSPGDEVRREFGVKPEELLIGTVGHFAPLKGYEDLIRAVPLIRARLKKVKFIIAGGAPYPAYRDYRREMEKLIDRLGLTGKVVCPGERTDLPALLGALDIFVLPSRSEGFGRSNLEAMAAGLPVVSTRVGGVPEVVAEGETGLLVSPHDPAAIAGAIIRLGEDRALRRRLGEAGRRRARLFSVEKMVEGVVEVYGLLAERGRAGDSRG